MHTKKDYKFDTEVEAQEFADRQRANKCPSEDLYVSGPFFHDDDVVFKNMMWASKGLKYWVVNVESYY
jgi:hypothetical protein